MFLPWLYQMCVCVLQKCRYSDGDLTLIYFGGDECSSGFQRMSVINFECNETAGEFALGFYPCSALMGVCVLGRGMLCGAARSPPVGVATSSPQTRVGVPCQ